MQVLIGWFQTEIPSLLKLLESGSLIALQSLAIWVLWKAYREKEQLLQELLVKTTAANERKEIVLERLERYLELQSRSEG